MTAVLSRKSLRPLKSKAHGRSISISSSVLGPIILQPELLGAKIGGKPLNQLDDLDSFLVICHEDRKLSYALEMTNGINVRYQ